jgi:L-asparaginase
VTAGRVLVLGTGGTIGSVVTPNGLEPLGGLRADGWIDAPQVEVEDVFSLSSAAIGLAEIARIFARISRAYDEGFTGVVVAHGTDTLVETAFVLTLLHRGSSLPIVLTGAMRAPDQAGTDAVRNLRDAVAVIRSGVDFGCHVVVVFDGRVLPGLTAQKVSSTSLAAFDVPNGGQLAEVIEGRIQLQARANQCAPTLVLDPESTGTVALIGAMPADDGTALRACAEQVDGVVIAGLGGGHVAPQMMDAVEWVAQTKPVVVTTGTAAGGALTGTYIGSGSEQSLAAAGAITGWSLGPRKAALALGLCLGQTTDLQQLRTIMKDNMKGSKT